MLTVNQASIKSSTVPNVYVKSIDIRDAGSLDVRRSTTVGDSRAIRSTRSYPGADITYNTSQRLPRNNTTDEGLELTLKIVLQDTFLNGSPQGWLSRGKRQDRRFLKLKVIQSTNSRLTRVLSQNNFFDTPNAPIPRGFVNFVDYEVREVDLTRDIMAGESLVIEENPNSEVDIVSLLKQVTFNVPQSTPTHLSYFVYCEIAVDDNDSPRVNTHSPVVREAVIQRSSVVNLSSVLYDSSQKIWAGPAHNHPQTGWMEGAYHIDQPHGSLTRTRVPNFKIKDSRIFKSIFEMPIDLTIPSDQVREDYLSNAYLTRGENNNSSLMFSFDHLRYMVGKSKFGKLFLNSNQSVVQQLLLRSKITELSIIRRKVRTAVRQNTLESTAERAYEVEADEEEVVLVTTSDSNSVLTSAAKYNAPGAYYNRMVNIPLSETPPAGYNKMGQIQELNIPINRGRTFSVIDTDISEKPGGKYQYSVRLQVDDGAFSYLRDKKSELARARRTIMDYKERSERNRSFNARTGQFSQTFINNEIDSFNYIVLSPEEIAAPANSISSRSSRRSIQPWLAAIVKYVEILDLLTNITDERKSRIVRSIYSHINPISGTPRGIETFLSLIESLDGKIQTLLSPVRLGHTEDKSSSSQAAPQSFISTENHFSDIFDASIIKSTGFNYFNTRAPSPDLLSLTVDQFEQRVNAEINRYSSNIFDQDQLQEEFEFLSNPMVDALVSNTTRYSYIGPSTVEISNRMVDLLSESRDDLDYTAVKGTLLSIVADGTNRSLSLPARKDMIAMLGDSNKGATKQRLDRLDVGLSAIGEMNGIFIERGTRSIVKTQTEMKTVSSANPVASPNKFSRADKRDPENTERETAQTVGAIAMLGRITDRLSLSQQPKGPTPVVYFDLTRNDNLINANIVANNQTVDNTQRANEISRAIDSLPQQVKLLLRNRGSFYNNTTLSTTASDSQADGFIFNFGMLRIVEYLSGYADGLLKNPSWRILTPQVISGLSGPIMCRIRSYLDNDTNVGIFETFNTVPVYNEYFIITPSQADLIKRPILASPIAVNNSPTQSYNKEGLLRGVERDTFINLMLTMSRHNILGQKYQYSWTSPPLAPTDRRGKTTGIPDVQRSAAPPSTPTPRTGRPAGPTTRSTPSGRRSPSVGTRAATTRGGGGGY